LDLRSLQLSEFVQYLESMETLAASALIDGSAGCRARSTSPRASRFAVRVLSPGPI